MFTRLPVTLVYMAMRVLPLPRWAALMARNMTLKIMPPLIMRKYRVEEARVSSLAPAQPMMVSAPATQRALIRTPTTRVMMKAVSRTRLAPRWSCWPRRRATRALMATFRARKKQRLINLGWVVRPTAATEELPRLLTIRESTRPAKETKKLSTTAGQAIWKAKR